MKLANDGVDPANELDIVLVDDGTLDTVFECSRCHRHARYVYGTSEDDMTYDKFVAWAHEDARMTHDCID
jgi:hypothetical protein